MLLLKKVIPFVGLGVKCKAFQFLPKYAVQRVQKLSDNFSWKLGLDFKL